MKFRHQQYRRRKSQKLISAIILFGLALSSCERCHGTLDRNTPANHKEISPNPTLNLNLAKLDALINDTHANAPFAIASKALKYAVDVINNSNADKKDFATAQRYARDAVAVFACESAASDALTAARYATLFAGYIVAEIVGIAPDDGSSRRLVARDATNGVVNYFIKTDASDADCVAIAAADARASVAIAANDAHARAGAASHYAAIATELDEKVNELKEFFDNRKNQRT